jgi:signal transduction histidine kinase
MYMESWILAAVLLSFVLACSVLWRRGRSMDGKPEEQTLVDIGNEELNPHDNSRRDFVANVSHELRTPVAIVKGFAETLDDSYDELSGKKRREFIGKIRKNSDRLCSLVGDLLYLAELESPSHALRPEPSSLSVVVRTVVDRLGERLDLNTQRIRLELAEERKPMSFDPLKVECVVENLLSNALRYARDSSVITIRTIFDEDPKVIRCEVQDDGCGIPEKDVPHLFERFYRVDKGRSRESGGTGLGLSIVKHIVELHGGTVSVRSKLGEGTTFSFSLPCDF